MMSTTSGGSHKETGAEKKSGGIGCALWIAIALALFALIPDGSPGMRILVGAISLFLFAKIVRRSEGAQANAGGSAGTAGVASQTTGPGPAVTRSELVGLLVSRITQLDQKFRNLVDDAVLQHSLTLQRKRMQLIRVDDYGNTFSDAWNAERSYFVTNVIVTSWRGGELTPEQTAYALDAIEAVASMEQPTNVDVASLDPYEYEHFCASLLKSAGWDTHVTVASGDQGVDIVATRGGKTLVVQAKRYTNSVGNAAVQQVFSGKQHMRADLAAVVSPAPYTRSAQELARTTGVLLLHHDALSSL